ncbi:helix-turn-helix domain-containing protein [Burkholderia territorii]|uniref:helix-turn-helix domain-containing protein n=1 Tax=Burkholderia territorii TaxID=1503055 RepID=UPI000AEB0C1E|nr:AraC family transcriptional regulator [Burkholderia territorii]
MAINKYRSSPGGLSGIACEGEVKDSYGVGQCQTTDDSRFGETDKFGCPIDLFATTEGVIAGGITFYRKRAFNVNNVTIGNGNLKNSFIVGVSLSSGHQREILTESGQGTYKFKKYAIHIRNANLPYSARIDGNYDFVLSEIPYSWLSEIDRSTLRRGIQELSAPIGHVDCVLGNLVRSLFPSNREFEKVDPCFAEKIGVAFGLRLLDKYGEIHTRRKSGSSRLAKWQEDLAKELLLCGTLKATSISDIATACQVSTSYFIRSFKTATGHSPYQWQLRERIDMAKRLLYDNKLSVATISEACGFSDIHQFSKAFRKVVGITASQWRNAYVLRASNIKTSTLMEELTRERGIGDKKALEDD